MCPNIITLPPHHSLQSGGTPHYGKARSMSRNTPSQTNRTNRFLSNRGSLALRITRNRTQALFTRPYQEVASKRAELFEGFAEVKI